MAEAALEEQFQKLNATEAGLTAQEAEKRLQQYGPNSVEEKKESTLKKFLLLFWGPIPWMIEAAALLSALVGHVVDLIIILVMLFFNALIEFWQDRQAANALEELKKELALTARALRDGQWRDISAAELVPGDVIRIRAGDVIPADGALFNGQYLSVDQSTLTGESLPVNKTSGEEVFSGSLAKQGEMHALVTRTGGQTKFAQTAKLVESAGAVSHFQKAVLSISDYLIYLSLGLAGILIVTQLVRGDSFFTVIQFILILVVAAIPVAMPAVLSVTMALGALTLSRKQAIVSRLQAIEEIAGIDILCSDKTGTLTQNKITLGRPVVFEAKNEQDLVLTAALASKEENRDAIDAAIFSALQDSKAGQNFSQTDFTPFDPVHKRTEAKIKGQDGETFLVTKGAPQVIMNLCDLDESTRKKAEDQINDFASRGNRTLGVARKPSNQETWHFLGILPLFDPPREDSAETIQKAGEHGIAVRMITGDNKAIAREISQQLGLETNVASAEDIFAQNEDLDTISEALADKIERAEGFAEVFPEHKYGIVKALQKHDHLVAMTGDGVNDAPALKQADVGIAVSGATNAAQAAADLILTAPGLSVIIDAVEEARRIFERMNNYTVYRITETIRIMFFVALAMMVFDFYPLTTVMIILLALLNDLPILSIAYDHTWLDPKPVRWQMKKILTLSTVLGLVGVLETFGLLLIADHFLNLNNEQLQSFIYLKLAVAGHFTLFIVRSQKAFWKPPHPAPILLSAIIGTQIVAALIVGLGLLMPAIPWSNVALVWGYCVVWAFIEDWIKLRMFDHLNMTGPRHKKHINRILKRFHPVK